MWICKQLGIHFRIHNGDLAATHEDWIINHGGDTQPTFKGYPSCSNQPMCGGDETNSKGFQHIIVRYSNNQTMFFFRNQTWYNMV